MRKFYLSFYLVLLPVVSSAQDRIGYSYDASGNRVKREIVMPVPKAMAKQQNFSSDNQSFSDKQYKFMKYFILKWSSEKKQNNKTKRSLWCRLLHKMIVPLSANPDFDDKIEDVTLWFIEYDDVVNHIANREIGFAKDGRIIVKMPDDRNYGYWLDTNCELEDFKRWV